VADERVVVVGAGPAGLSVAAMLKRRRIEALVLERADTVGSSWRSRYDSLRLNTPRLTSTLAGYRMPRRYGRWPVRDDVVEYLDEYARRHALRIEFGTELTGVAKADGNSAGWRLATTTGEITTRFAVLATGHEAEPKLPDWPGRDTFRGELIHSAEYRNPEPFRGKDMLVVSVRNSGSEIAHELATRGGCRVWAAMRTPPSVFPREWPPGLPGNYPAILFERLPNAALDQVAFFYQRVIYGNLAKYGIPRAPVGVQTTSRTLHKSTLIDDGFVKALKVGKLELVPSPVRFEGADVVLEDGRRLQPHAVIAATGYTRNLPQLVGHLGVLDDYGVPTLDGRAIRAREHPNAAGLFFNGYYASAAGQLRFMRIDGRNIARAVARRLRAQRSP
jgi:hypothetical protein